jgi:biopolymer transport protein ExbB/TolQ
MGLLTNVFYFIATSLLIPVMLALLWALGRVLLHLGGTLAEHAARRRMAPAIADFSRALEQGTWQRERLPSGGLVATSIGRLSSSRGDAALAAKISHDCQLTWRAELERLRRLARTGPALGLMGTLIPLGPALVGLAAGDLQMMSHNLMIAFATTVVGLLVGTVATCLASVKRGWYEADATLVMFAAHRLAEDERPIHGEGNARGAGSDAACDEPPADRSERRVAERAGHARREGSYV